MSRARGASFWSSSPPSSIIILIIAAVASAVLGDYKDAIAIFAIVILNGVLGFRQEYKAEKTMSALRQLATPVVRVRRDGDVRGDVGPQIWWWETWSCIEAGNLVPADCRLIESASLRVQESALTGESEPVEKIGRAALSGTEVPLADRLNMVFMGTAASYGRARGPRRGHGHGYRTRKIAGMIQKVRAGTHPSAEATGQLGRWLALAALVLVVDHLRAGPHPGRRRRASCSSRR